MFLDVFKDGELLESIALSASKRSYVVGRQEGVADILLTHASVSREQARLTVSASGSLTVTDLHSAQGTTLSGKALQPNKPYTVAPGRSLVFGKSTRVFKLREGGKAFVVEGGGSVEAGVVREPMTETLLQILRGEAGCAGTRGGASGPQLRLRPDGFVPLSALAASPLLSRFGPPSIDGLRQLAASRPKLLQLTTDERGEQLVRAVSEHAPTSRVDPTLRLRALDLGALPAGTQLYHGAKFGDWNGLRSKGIGGLPSSTDTLPPVRLSSISPSKDNAYRMIGAPSVRCDLVVELSAERLGVSGTQVWIDQGATELAAANAMANSPPALALVVLPPPGEDVLGVDLFERVVGARDGSELMSAAEIEPIRARRAAEAEARAAAEVAAAEKQRQVEEQRAAARARREREDSKDEEQASERYNPYLSHLEMEPPLKPSNRSAAGVAQVRKRTRGENSD